MYSLGVVVFMDELDGCFSFVACFAIMWIVVVLGAISLAVYGRAWIVENWFLFLLAGLIGLMTLDRS